MALACLMLLWLCSPVRAENAAVSLPLEQILPGDESKERSVRYELIAEEPDAPLPAEAAGRRYTFTVAGSSGRELGEMQFSRAGEYHYLLRPVELLPDAAGWTAEPEEIQILVVAEQGPNGFYTQVAAYLPDGSKGELRFTYSYDREEATTAAATAPATTAPTTESETTSAPVESTALETESGNVTTAAAEPAAPSETSPEMTESGNVTPDITETGETVPEMTESGNVSPEGTKTQPAAETTVSGSTETRAGSDPRTGDGFSVWRYAWLFLTAAALLAILLFKAQKDQDE